MLSTYTNLGPCLQGAMSQTGTHISWTAEHMPILSISTHTLQSVTDA